MKNLNETPVGSEVNIASGSKEKTSRYYVIDSYSWIEYFLGTKMGAKTRGYIEGGNAITPTVVLLELKYKFEREKRDFLNSLKFIEMRTRLVSLDKEIALIAGELYLKRKRAVRDWSPIDSVILATASIFDAEIVTGDEHFRDLGRVIMIK